ncbi:MAG TPA: transketolase [Mycobacteriales bacterium]|nr:transketolase [Mycobacteriales bacterium]
MRDPQQWRDLGQQLRIDSVRAAAAAGSGHPTSSMSAADLVAVLVAGGHLRYDFDAPEDPANDHLVFSKGHASPLLYSLYRAVGAITDDELLSFRKLGSRLQGHPTPEIPWVDVATGSLGQGLPIAVGIALAALRLDRMDSRAWVLCGDSEMAEGSMWEAVAHAGHVHLDNLVAVIDVNRLGQRGETMEGWDTSAYARRLEAFGWRVLEVDGHDVVALDEAFAAATSPDGRPVAVVARTLKGKGVGSVEDKPDWHGKAITGVESAVAELGGRRDIVVRPSAPARGAQPYQYPTKDADPPTWEVGAKVATRQAYGAALAALGHADGRVVALDAEVSNSTYAITFQQEHPDRFFEMWIAEQLMVAAAVGMQVRGWRPFASTFAAFLARAYDFVRMAAISQADIRLVGSHAGVSIGEDGPSQMALEDLACFRAVHGSTVLYPSDANQTAQLVAQMAETKGISYLRTTREATAVLYDAATRFHIGGSHVLRASDADAVTVVAAGITLHEALAAADTLAAEGITVRVIDLYSVKPVDVATLRRATEETAALVTVEDHWGEGGIGDAVLSALAEAGVAARVHKLAVRMLPGSGTPAEMLRVAGIDRTAIADALRSVVAGR